MCYFKNISTFYCRYDRFKNSGKSKDAEDSKKTTVAGKTDADNVKTDKVELAAEKKEGHTKDATANTNSANTTATSVAVATK